MVSGYMYLCLQAPSQPDPGTFRPTEKWPQSLELISRWSKNRYYNTPTFCLARGEAGNPSPRGKSECPCYEYY